QELSQHDQKFKEMVEEANSKNKVLRYIASYHRGEARIKLKTVGQAHPFYNLKGSDNIISIQTSRYRNPLVIKGAGAGAQVTAAGILADIFKIAVSAKKRRIF
ncbi:MAG TPA: bifunctional aspartate kinase/homoserine dehydrogenase I, partial [bacterium]|nr:bifunctional aspartate kinase/homoserine dehydrogenase I [bacterium]